MFVCAFFSGSNGRSVREFARLYATGNRDAICTTWERVKLVSDRELLEQLKLAIVRKDPSVGGMDWFLYVEYVDRLIRGDDPEWIDIRELKDMPPYATLSLVEFYKMVYDWADTGVISFVQQANSDVGRVTFSCPYQASILTDDGLVDAVGADCVHVSTGFPFSTYHRMCLRYDAIVNGANDWVYESTRRSTLQMS